MTTPTRRRWCRVRPGLWQFASFPKGTPVRPLMVAGPNSSVVVLAYAERVDRQWKVSRRTILSPLFFIVGFRPTLDQAKRCAQQSLPRPLRSVT